MKEFNPIIDREGEKTEVQALKPIEKQHKYHGTLVVHRGHKCFEYDFDTCLIKEAEFETVAVEYGTEGNVSKKIAIRPNCGYASALNKKNAIRKLEKLHGVKLLVLF
jgi:hypothetical protein